MASRSRHSRASRSPAHILRSDSRNPTGIFHLPVIVRLIGLRTFLHLYGFAPARESGWSISSSNMWHD